MGAWTGATRLSGLRHKYDDVHCAQFGLWRGARRVHPRPWGCNRRATKPQAKFGATLRAAVLFRPDFVARSLQIHCGICSSLTPRLAEKSLAANAMAFMFMTTKDAGQLARQVASCPEGKRSSFLDALPRIPP